MGGIIMMLSICVFAGGVYVYTKTPKGKKWMSEH